MLKNYIKIAFKVMLRNKLFTFISLFGICFTLLFLILLSSVIDYGFGPVKPESKLERTLSITMGALGTERGGNTMGPLFSPWFFRKYAKPMTIPEKISISSYYSPDVIYHGNKKIKLGIKYTDAEFWEICDFNFLEGVPYTGEEVAATAQVAVINQRMQNEYFDGESAVGKIFEYKDKRFLVKGVVENVSIIRIMPYSDIWLPMGHAEIDLDKPTLIGGFPGWYASLLAKDKRDIPAIKAEFQQQMEHIEFPEGHFNSILTAASSYQEALARQMFRRQDGNILPFMMILLGVATIFMLLPAINLVNINMSRIYERSSEIGIRKAYGASSIVLTGQFLVENIIITLLGGILSVILAVIILAVFNSSGILADTIFSINYRVFLVSMGFALFFGILSGVYPAWKMSRLEPVQAMEGGE
ncbi:MAG: ABC transporter permease [Candidatus Cloacimonetes bacterium]|nr:ABC transporter permease [Candidatus Cloacimonadota bacterium]